MRILRQDYDFDVKPESYVMPILDECFEGVNNFYDFGCGRGHWAKFLLKRYNIIFNCFDIDKAAESHARNTLDKYLFEPIEENFNYDVVFLGCVTEMINENELESSINHIVNKLDIDKKKGKVLLYSAFYNPFSIKWIIYRILGRGNPKKFFVENKYYRNFYTKNDIINFFNKRGLKVTNSVRCDVIPKGPKVLRNFLRFILPMEFLYDTFYLLLEFDINKI